MLWCGVSRAFGLQQARRVKAIVPFDGAGYDVRLPKATAQLTDQFSIRYESIDGAHLWRKPKSGLVGTTALTAHSGMGKSTLLGHLFRRLRHVHNPAFPFEFSPDLHATAPIEVAFVPQNPPFVYHWPLGRVLPGGSPFYNSLMQTKPFDATRRLSQFSGGEIRRIYASSCLAFLAASAARTGFLLLDETFDGVGPVEMERCLKGIRDCWIQLVQLRSLQVLLVTHHDHVKLIKEIPDAIGLEMTIDSSASSDEGITVHVHQSS